MQPLTSILIKNFKAYKEAQEIPLKPLTFIYGPNSSGKSSITHALAFLKHVQQTNGKCSPDEVDLSWDKVTLGGWQNLIHGHNSQQSMELGLGFGALKTNWKFSNIGSVPTVRECIIENDGFPMSVAKNDTAGKLEWKISRLDHSPWLNDAKPAYFRQKAWDVLIRHNKTKGLNWKLPTGELVDQKSFDAAFKEYIRSNSRTATGLYPLEPQIVNLRETTPEQNFDFKTLIEDAASELCEAFDTGSALDKKLNDYFKQCLDVDLGMMDQRNSLTQALFASHVHLGPSREPPPRAIDHQSLQQNAQFGPWLDLLEQKELREQVNDALERLKLPYQLVTRWQQLRTFYPSNEPPNFESAEPDLIEFSDSLEQLAFKIKNTRVTLSHKDLGYGVSMLLPILVALNSSKIQLITMEQPELHLHPKQQTDLGDELITAALRSEGSKQLIIETHSEHLLLRIMRRMRQTFEGRLPDGTQPVTPEDVALLYVSPGIHGSVVQEIGLNVRGELIKAWPDGFFEEGFNEMFD